MDRDSTALEPDAPAGVIAVRVIATPQTPSYRQVPSSLAPARIKIQIVERTERRPGTSYTRFVVFPVAFAAMVVAVLLDKPVFPFMLLPVVAATLYEGLRGRGVIGGAIEIGYRGTLRLEDGWVRSESSKHQIDAGVSLALIENVHVLQTRRGIDVLAELKDGARLRLATAIADIEVARYVARRIAEASDEAKR